MCLSLTLRSYQPATEDHNIVPDGYDIGRWAIRHGDLHAAYPLQG
jgi:hypothetical protein